MSDQTANRDTAQKATRRTKDTPSHGINKALLDRAVPVDQLDPHPQNARRRSERAEAELRQSLEVNGQYRTVVARKLGRRLQLLAGHGTVQAARQLGRTHIAVDVHAGLSDEAAARIVLVDNRTNDLAGYDDALLAELLSSLPDLEGTGYDDDDLQALLIGLDGAGEPVALTDPDDVPEPPKDPRSVLGDVWLLGPHRVLCGDSTDIGAHDAVLGSTKADVVWTDPPYGVDYVGGTKDALKIENDGATGVEDLLRGALGAAFASSKPGAAWYVAFADKTILHLLTVLIELGVYRQTIIWAKDQFVLGRGDYHSRHEPILYGWHPGAARLHPVEDRTQDTLWEIPRPKRSADHPTMKPVALIQRALENSSKRGGTVLDPFGGSGSTLLAAHVTGRLARLVELDPRYVDVICRRYQEHTGVVPVLEATGEPVDFTTAKEE